MISYDWKLFILALLLLAGAQYLAGLFTSRWYQKIKGVAENLSSGFEGNDKLNQEVKDLRTLEERKRHLGLLTNLVGALEFGAFHYLTLLKLSGNSSTLLDGASIITLVFAWVGIKTVGNYQQWAGGNFGRAMFYVFLLGTFINIFLAVLGAYIFSSL
jgi:hypothetical protein